MTGSGDSARARLGILGGSGLYRMAGLEQARTMQLETPFGPPSDDVVLGRLEGLPVAFLARHGRGHHLLPTEINYRANVYAMKALGAEFLVSASAVGSLREEIKPLHVAVPDQFIDRTRHRADTFFGEGVVAHVSLADPFCPPLREALADAAEEAGGTVHRGGTYLCMEGPQFSTRAESELYRSWSASVIGMTNLQEARLAREAELCFATLAMVTDFDCWKTDEEPVSVEVVIDRLGRNARLAERSLAGLARRIVSGLSGGCGCHLAMESAIITAPDSIGSAARERLGVIGHRVLGR